MKNEKAKHTPLPWILFDEGSIIGHEEKKVIKTEDSFDWICSMQVSNCPNFREDAQFIIKACNNYEATKDQRDELLAALEMALDRFTDNDMIPPNYALSRWIDRARAAITKATEV